MRRIVVLALLLAVAYWLFTSLRGDNGALAGSDGARGADLSVMVAAPTGQPVNADGAPATPPTQPAQTPAPAADGTKVPADAELERAFAALVKAIEGGDATARDQARRLLERSDLASAHRTRLQALLAVPASAPAPSAPAAEPAARRDDAAAAATEIKDVEEALRRLGDNNGFLHNADGLAVAARALELIAALDDEAAVAAGTKLLDRCMRGSIERQDRQAIEFVDRAYKAHRPRAERVICNPASLAKSRSYSVEKGDSLAGIAGRFRREGIAIDESSLAILNRIHNPNAIRVGQRIRIPLEPLRAVVEKRSYLMAVYLGDQLLRLYWVGHGAEGKTPVVTFTVVEKLKHPDWDSPKGRIPYGSPENILGEYFLKFEHPSFPGFGAHGTPMPETIGTQSSMGCIRMYDADIEELFRLLPRKSTVEIRDSH